MVKIRMRFISSSVSDWWDLAVKIDEYKAEFLSVWKASKIDVLICPTFPFPACPTGAVQYLVGEYSNKTFPDVDRLAITSGSSLA